MKKAKIMLTGLTVLAVVGGAMAFSAKTFSNHQLFCENATSGCTIAVNGFVTEEVSGAATTTEPCKNVTGVPAASTTFWSISSDASNNCASTGTVTLTNDAN